MTDMKIKSIPLHTLDLEQVLQRTSVEYGLKNKTIARQGNKLAGGTGGKDRLKRLRDWQRKGLFETAEKLLDLNFVLNFVKREVDEAVTKSTKGKKTKGENNTYGQRLNNIMQLLWFVTPEEAGMTAEQLTNLRERGYEQSEELNEEYSTRRAKGEMSAYEKNYWIPDWKEFETQVEQNLNNTDYIYGLANPTSREIFEHQQRLQLYSVVRFYNTRSALRTVVLFTHPDCKPREDNVLFYDAHGSMYICWNKTKSIHGAFIQQITDPLKSRLYKFIKRFRKNALYLFPNTRGLLQQQDTYREALQSQAELVTGKRYGVAIMRKCQIKAQYNGNLTPYEKERLSREFHHSAPEHELYVRKDPPAEGADEAEDNLTLDDDLPDNDQETFLTFFDNLDDRDLDFMDDIVLDEEME
ncbi:hypothetical protein HK104_011444 [Borealophlyctis nickersoniae]|nr:hypothetical protein HK104_011444 [Borealophlyctis nickersoniae]